MQATSSVTQMTEEQMTLKRVQEEHTARQTTISQQHTTPVETAIPMQPDESGPSPYYGADFCVPIGPDFSLVTGLCSCLFYLLIARAVSKFLLSLLHGS